MISLARYQSLLRQPTLRAAIAASVLGRLPIGVAGLAILLYAQEQSGSFAQGGTMAACYVAGLAVFAPLLGRMIDRQGPRPILFACAFAFPAFLLALVAAPAHWQALGITQLLAGCAGACFPPITVCMRTFFRQRLKDEGLLAAAYSMESVLIETIFILGPVLVALFTALASPATAVLFAAGCGLVGTLLFVRSQALRDWRIEDKQPGSLFGPLSEPGFVPLLAVIVCYASAFGLVEIGTTAFATEIGHPAFAGVLLGIMSIGSAAGGLVYGSRSWRFPLPQQFTLMLIVMGCGVLPLALLRSPVGFSAWCLIAGIAMAPALIMQAMLVARIARADHSTEAFTWSSTGLLAGVGLGLAGGGVLLEFARSPSVFFTAAALAILAGAIALPLLKRR